MQHLNPTLPTVSTSPTTPHASTHAPPYDHNQPSTPAWGGGGHHHTDQHHRPTHTHRRTTSHRLCMISTHNPQITQQIHPTVKPLGTRTHTLPTQHTWYQIQDGPKLDNSNGHAHPILHNQCNNTIKYPPIISPKPFPTYNHNQGYTYTAFAECPQLSSKLSHNHQRSLKSGVTIGTSTYRL